MRKKNIGGLEVSALGFGCMGMSHAYGEALPRKESYKLLAEAVELGYTHFDTAEVYGFAECPHHNEEIVGEGLKPYRKDVVIATKFGHRFDYSGGLVPFPLISDASPATIRKSLEGSLKRLQTDYIDLYYLHRLDPKVPVEVVAEEMAKLIKEGKILHWGLSETDADMLRRADALCHVAAVQNRYSMMARGYEKMFSVLEELGTGLVAFSPLANGFLADAVKPGTKFDPTNDYRAAMPQYTDEGFEANRQLLALVRNLAEEHNATPAQISLAWMLCKKPWITAIPGSRHSERIRENAGAADIILTESQVKDMDALLDKTEMSGVFGVTTKDNGNKN